MKIAAKIFALIFVLSVLTSCATFSGSPDYTPEPIAWREFLDC